MLNVIFHASFLIFFLPGIVIRCMFSAILSWAHSFGWCYRFLLPLCHLNDSFRRFFRIHKLLKMDVLLPNSHLLWEKLQLWLSDKMNAANKRLSIFQSVVCWRIWWVKKFQAYPDVAKIVCGTRALFKFNGWTWLRNIESLTLLKQKKHDYGWFVLKRQMCTIISVLVQNMHAISVECTFLMFSLRNINILDVENFM